MSDELLVELSAALKAALPYVKVQARFVIDKRAQTIVQECNSALDKANSPCASAASRSLDCERRGKPPARLKLWRAAVDLRSDLHFARLDGPWDFDRASDFVRALGEKFDRLVFATQEIVDADVVTSPEPFGEVANRIALDLDAAAYERRSISAVDFEPPAWSATLEKFV
jgi:hypothetical protein